MKSSYIPDILRQKTWKKKAHLAQISFELLQKQASKMFLSLETGYSRSKGLTIKKKFKKNRWKKNKDFPEQGGGSSLILRGELFEKVGVNFSSVYGKFPSNFKNNIKGASKDPRFFATGISIVAHMKSPFIPAAHFNSRFIATKDCWFGGGMDFTPTYRELMIRRSIHKKIKAYCDQCNPLYYRKFSKWCEEYFYLNHRAEERGVGGIFFDYLQDNWDNNFSFTQGSGQLFLSLVKNLISKNINKKWNNKQREKLLKKRGRYVEFNLLYDRGTTFGLKTGGNTEAILMSLPPSVKW